MRIFLTCIAMCIILLSVANAQPASGGVGSDQVARMPKMIEIFKPDGSLQCGGGAVITLDEAEAELREADVRVQGARKRHDGLKRIAMCGAPTGQILVFEIIIHDWEKAQPLGYKRLT